jgi:hypothetical protein
MFRALMMKKKKKKNVLFCWVKWRMSSGYFQIFGSSCSYIPALLTTVENN